MTSHSHEGIKSSNSGRKMYQIGFKEALELVEKEVEKIYQRRLEYLKHTQMNFDEKCGWNKAMEIDNLQIIKNLKND